MLSCACVALAWVFLVLYISLDVNYFIRLASIIGLGRLFQKKLKPTDTTSIYGLCTTQDVDIFWRHMNNARYVRELDFARFDYYDRSGLYQEIVKLKGNAMQGASNVRYRRTIPIFSFYRVDTKLVWWDDKSIYLEQQFVTPRDGFVRTIAMSKQNIVGVDVPSLMRRVVGERPEQPPELMHWLRSVELSSARLRRSD
ncbi:hypothetical protein R5R35_014218 [Gryllus longicercus]|uniref:Protein THEM6 n=1 Tax=Gryllus longicercus TaxID=2509291 RepID=A0AAN9W602_9ORTH